ncbi:hypothetical protein B0H17DRAFT_1136231 [Mycena rosella]|uniref:Uncharacterized protein n=1 Tax=Mycena rosella TaxID=1033263 RepID=A0AAD7DEF6_MYCRO|nr:hypothetical protein B0H17DRAFT_1136231 [Mycena rosella]
MEELQVWPPGLVVLCEEARVGFDRSETRPNRALFPPYHHTSSVTSSLIITSGPYPLKFGLWALALGSPHLLNGCPHPDKDVATPLPFLATIGPVSSAGDRHFGGPKYYPLSIAQSRGHINVALLRPPAKSSDFNMSSCDIIQRYKSRLGTSTQASRAGIRILSARQASNFCPLTASSLILDVTFTWG